MIELALFFLKTQLSNYLKLRTGSEDKVELIPIFDKNGKLQVSNLAMILVNIEEERVMKNQNLYRETPQGTIAKTYRLAFKCREPLWRYKVINRNEQELTNPGVRETDTPWEFTHSGDHVFVSNSPMPLIEAPIKGIALRSDQTDAASVLITDLPNPDPNLIKPDPGNPATIYSDIYVYL